MSDSVPGPFRVPAPAGTQAWSRPCPSCGGQFVDLSYAVARSHVELAWEEDKKRRDKIAVIVSAPLAVVGLLAGLFVSVGLTATTKRVGVFNIAIPFLVAGALFTVSSKILEQVLPKKVKDPDISLVEVDLLEQVRKAEDG